MWLWMSTIAVAPVRRAVTTSMTKTAMARPDLPLGEAPRERLAVKKLKAAATLALTGRPVENRLGDLWSIFDFVNPGLLGSPKGSRDSPSVWPTGLKAATGRCASLARPYILRRMKMDKTVIADLPHKTEIKVFCPLSRHQAALREQAVKELTEQLAAATGSRSLGRRRQRRMDPSA